MARKIVGQFTSKFHIPRPRMKFEDKKENDRAQRAINSGLVISAKYVRTTLSIAVESSLKSSTWNWPQETKRQNGSTAGLTRDILDKGELLKRHNYHEILKNKTEAIVDVLVTSRYATIVHSGGVIQPYGDPKLPTFTYPARPWINAAIRGTHGRPKPDFNALIEKGMKEAWNKIYLGGTAS